ncbi:class I SAM-dependent methyltransferase [Saccharospirillum impatiens]|uniref:class I SAM-dependent methyltransferase n=1 Tax=Saccharospirillum impatiens TaxID=169438 RepID=UPI00041BDBE0|nr:class I SAM-dependent methyltransferase [Saccharospirillum impatiens]
MDAINHRIDFYLDSAQPGHLIASQTQARLALYAQEVSERPDGLFLTITGGALGLASGDMVKQHPVCVDFIGGAARHRQQFGGGRSQAIAKAVGLHQRKDLVVLDATAGLGRDAFVLASLGATVIMMERHPVVRLLLTDGLERARSSGDPVFDRMSMHDGTLLNMAHALSPDVVYLDPMYPERRSKAAVKKDMALFHALVGADEDADALLAPALTCAQRRVVVKRPRIAPPLDGQKPGLVLAGKSSRFDIYPLKSISND